MSERQGLALAAAVRWMTTHGVEKISVEQYSQLRRDDYQLPDIDEIYSRFGNWHEFERQTRARAVSHEPPSSARLGPRSRPSALAGRAAQATV